MVASVTPQLFTDWKNFPSAELNISRLFQVIPQTSLTNGILFNVVLSTY